MSLCAVFQIGSLGDTVVSIPALRSVKHFLGDCSEYLLISKFDSASKVAPSHVFDMVWKPAHVASYSLSGSKFPQGFSAALLIAKLHYYRPRHCVYLMPADRSQQQIDRDRLFFKTAGVRHFIGFRPLTGPELASEETPTLRDTQAYLRFIRLWGEAASPEYSRFSAVPCLEPGEEAVDTAARWLRKVRHHLGRKLVAVSPYSNSASKNLSQAATAELLVRLEKSLGVEAVLVGGKKDFSHAQAAIDAAGAGSNACGIFSLRESAALLQHCQLAICVDSGPMHLAAALAIPLIVAFSRMNTQLGRWFPLGSGHTILYREVACAGCRLAECNVPGHPCMTDINVDQILGAASAKLSGLPIISGNFGSTKVFSAVQPRTLKAAPSLT